MNREEPDVVVNGNSMPWNVYQAIVLRSALGLLEKGILPNRQMTKGRTLAAASQITTNTYPISVKGCKQARDDLKTWLDEHNPNAYSELVRMANP